MPQSLDGSDRKLIIAAGMLLVVLMVVAPLVSPPQVTGGSSITSSYSPAWNGAKAAFLLLQDLGYDVKRWESSPTQIAGDPKNEVLILAEPLQAPSNDERSAIRDFLENGGRLLATGAAASQFVPEAAFFSEGDPTGDKSEFYALSPSPLIRGAPHISMIAPDNWHPVAPQQLIVYGSEETAAVVTYSVGRGQVIWWAAAGPLTNDGIRDSANLTFFLNSVGPPGTHILWDEYFHGVHGSLLSVFAHTPVMWGALQCGLLFLVIVATYSRRLGPIHLPSIPSRLSPLEFVDTLGDLYNSAHASAAAVQIADQHFRFLLTRKLGVPISTPAADLAAEASQSLGWERNELLEILNQCDLTEKSTAQKSALRDEAAVHLVQKLFDYSQRLGNRRTDLQERYPG